MRNAEFEREEKSKYGMSSGQLQYESDKVRFSRLWTSNISYTLKMQGSKLKICPGRLQISLELVDAIVDPGIFLAKILDFPRFFRGIEREKRGEDEGAGGKSAADATTHNLLHIQLVC